VKHHIIADNKEHEIKTVDTRLLRKCNQMRRNIKHQIYTICECRKISCLKQLNC